MPAMSLTTSMIPCCTCGAIIAPNPSNQCASCLATVDIGSIIRRGPGGGDLIIHQCRQCRKFDRGGDGKYYIDLEPESPEMMAILLKQIPALSGKNNQHMKRSGVQGLKILDSMFIWTEPNSMRMRVMLTIKADINDVSIQQRIKVEFIVHWKQCPDCIKVSRQRTWQAIVQLRQKRDDSRKGLLILELAIARNAEIRKDILSVQTKKNGFDFYFPSVDKARFFAQYLSKAAPMRSKQTTSLVSQDFTNNTANIKTTIVADMVPLCRDDLIIIQKRSKGVGNLSGRLCLVLKMSSVIHLVDASPVRDSDMTTRFADLHPETYWKGGEEKSYRLFLSPKRLVRFVVLDVELCEDAREKNRKGNTEDQPAQYQGPQSGVNKYALADVEVARESDFGVNDDTFRCVTHLGYLLQVGDTVLGYDITSTVLSSEAEWSMENAFNSSFVTPDVVLVRKVKGVAGASELSLEDTSAATKGDNERPRKGKAKSSASKKRDRRMKKEEKKQKKLEDAAARMGLDTDQNVVLSLDDFEEGANGEEFSMAVRREKEKFEEQIKLDSDLADDLEIVERELAMGVEETVEEDGSAENNAEDAEDQS